MSTDLPLSATLAQTLQELSRLRDQEQKVITEERTIELDDGSYAHEVISRTTPRRRPDTGEEVQTVTRRRVSTSAVQDNHVTTGVLNLQFPTKTVDCISSPSLGVSRSNSAAGSSSYSASAAQVAATHQPFYQHHHSGASVSSPPSQQQYYNNATSNNTRSILTGTATTIPAGFVSTGSSGVAGSSHGPGNWHYLQGNPHQHNHSHNMQPAGGAFRTEPLYQQQLNNEHMNAASPSRGVAWGGTRTTDFEPSRISPLHPQGNYAPLKYVTRRQLQEMRSRNQRRSLPTRIRSSSVPRLDDLIMEEERERIARLRRGEPEHPGGREFCDPDALDVIPVSMVLGGGGGGGGGGGARSIQNYHRSVSEAGSRPSSAGRASSASSQGRSHYSSSRSIPMPDVNGDDYVTLFAGKLAAIRGVSDVGVAPAYCGAAMQLLLRGTYLIHYGRSVPHERYFMLRLLANDLGHQQPYLVRSLHADSASYIEKIPLRHLEAMGGGCSTPRLSRYVIDQNTLRGPFKGDEQCEVSSNYAFSFYFRSKQTRRIVEVLALDDQTYRCWLLVLGYLANVNAGGADNDAEVDELAPDTPRSQSQAVASPPAPPGARPATQ